MKKALLIGLKDLQVIFRDRAALILMLAAPMVLTLGMGLVTGSFSGDDNSGLQDIQVVLVNQDGDEVLSQALVDLFQSEELTDLMAAETADSADTARQRVINDEIAAAVIIPPGFSESFLSATNNTPSIEIYANPGSPISAGVVRAVVDEFINRVETGRIGAQVAVTQLVMNGLVAPEAASAVGEEMFTNLVTADNTTTLVQRQDSADAGDRFNPLAILAPSMAILFLMYTVSLGGRSILAERHAGTLSRLFTTPTSTAQILGGKIVGIFFTGLAQLSILIIGTSLLFNLQWGDWLAVALLVPAIVAGASGWGVALAAFAKTPSQASSVGLAATLLFGILGGTFLPTENFPGWLQIVSKITPNAWGIEAFNQLAQGAVLNDILPALAGLMGMTAVLFTIAVWMFRRGGLVNK